MFESADDKFIQEQKEEAKLLRKSRWWQNKIAANCLCYYCQKPLKKNDVTMDHIVPIVRGGRSTKGNVVPACKECNNNKKYLTVLEWDEYLKKSTHKT